MVVIIGGGMVGLLLAAALASEDIAVTIIETKEPQLDWELDSFSARVSAINVVSRRMLRNLGVWKHVRESSYGTLMGLTAWDSVGGGEISFDSADVGVPDLGVIVENRELVRVLWEHCAEQPQISIHCPVTPKAINKHEDGFTIDLEDGTTLKASLIIGADGAHSWVRGEMAAKLKTKSYRQSAIVTVVKTQSAHENIGWQAFLPTGPLALLPLANPHRCAIVWSATSKQAENLMAMDTNEFECELNNEFGVRLGEIAVLTERRAIPLRMRHVQHYVEPRLALIGDAAHTIHPLAGQGVNLGFMDAACLAACLSQAKQKGQDFGNMKVLRRYERWRKGENALMIAAMRSFNDLFLSDSTMLVQARNMGLKITNRLTSLKNCFMKVAMGEMQELPPLAKK